MRGVRGVAAKLDLVGLGDDVAPTLLEEPIESIVQPPATLQRYQVVHKEVRQHHGLSLFETPAGRRQPLGELRGHTPTWGGSIKPLSRTRSAVVASAHDLPSALHRFDDLVEQVGALPRAAFLDQGGTLTPIAARPAHDQLPDPIG